MHMSVETGLPYMTPALAAIRKMAKDFGGAAKPSGAGGGDCAVALFPDEDATQAFISAISERGRTVIPVSVAGPAALLG
jgi:phosphomevalonate kinase